MAAVCLLMQAVSARGQAAVPGIVPTAERKWVDAWAVSYLPTTVNGARQAAPSFQNQTLRQNMFIKLGGSALRTGDEDRAMAGQILAGRR